MSLFVFISARAEQDMTLQYRWYLENADEAVALVHPAASTEPRS